MSTSCADFTRLFCKVVKLANVGQYRDLSGLTETTEGSNPKKSCFLSDIVQKEGGGSSPNPKVVG